jgi:hypothetical protein
MALRVTTAGRVADGRWATASPRPDALDMSAWVQVLPSRHLTVMSAAESEAAETVGKRAYAASMAALRLTAAVLRTGAGQRLLARKKP